MPGPAAGSAVGTADDATDDGADNRADDGAPHAVAALTAREQDVLRLVARGWTNRRVGAELFISDKTVSVHLGHVIPRLGAASRTDTASRAHRAGLLSLER